ncbi:isoaspartyl peptidase/L-asparaginase family protein [Pirellulaceae bacterium SH449]
MIPPIKWSAALGLANAVSLVLLLGQPGLWAQQSNSELQREPMANPTQSWSIAIHGGAGGVPSQFSQAAQDKKLSGLRTALQRGVELLEAGVDAVDVVEQVVRILEDDPQFNAGRGAVFNSDGNVSLDASLMNGADLTCGAVANVMLPKNPIQLARAVMDKTPHVMLTGDGADAFAKELEIPIADQDYFKTESQTESWKRWKTRQAARSNKITKDDYANGDDRLFYLGTVGCVVRDSKGNLAAATSTGGLLGKKYGRVGDSPVIGAGTYANNATCAISCTGEGELFIRHHIASAISARMQYLNESLETATKVAIFENLPKNSGGLISIDAAGNIELPFNTPMMARGRASSNGLFQVGLVDWAE